MWPSSHKLTCKYHMLHNATSGLHLEFRAAFRIFIQGGRNGFPRNVGGRTVRGVWGHIPPGNFCYFKYPEITSGEFQRWAILFILYIVEIF